MTNPNLGRKVGNRNKVPQRQWRKWTNHAKRVFNEVYADLRVSQQGVICHREAIAMPIKHWQVLRWNVAWLAADAANKGSNHG